MIAIETVGSGPTWTPQGGEDADEIVLRAYEAFAPGLARRMCSLAKTEAEADECCQEAFVRLLVEVRAGRTPASLPAWLSRVARNQLMSRIRHDVVGLRVLPSLALGGQVEGVEDAVVGRERLDTVIHAFAELPQRDQWLIREAARGRSSDALAEDLGISAAAVRTRLHRGRRRLREVAGRAA